MARWFRALALVAIGLGGAPFAVADDGTGDTHKDATGETFFESEVESPANVEAREQRRDAFEDHVSAGSGMKVVHGWTRAASGKSALVFAEVENETTEEIMLRGATTDVAADTYLVGIKVEGGRIKTEILPVLPIPGGRTMSLTPDGVAIELLDLSAPLAEGDEIEVTFEFSSGSLDVHVEVEAADATQSRHEGHAH